MTAEPGAIHPAAGGDGGACLSGPLAGFRVIDLTVNVLGPLATQALGDMGADVIKVEPPEGDPMRHIGPARSPGIGSLFLSANRNKASIVLDLKQPAARDALLRLADTADVFVHAMRPAAARRLGLDYPVLARRVPRLVYASAGGFRKDGPRQDLPAFDDVIQGLSGLPALIAQANGEARYVPMPLCDKLVGQALAAAIGLALLHRERTGRGQEVHVPMLETMLAFNLVEHLWHGTLAEPERGLGYPRMLTPYRRPHATRDGHICLLAVTDAQWRRVFDAIGRPELSADPRFAEVGARSTNVDALYRLLAEAIGQHDTAEWLRRFAAADIPCGPMQSLSDIVADPYLRETGFFERHDHPTEGTVVTTAIPSFFSDSPGRVRRLAPRLGADTHVVLSALGYSAAEIAALAQVP